MKLTSEELFNRISAMVATLAHKDINDREVIACANAIVEMVGQNDQAG